MRPSSSFPTTMAGRAALVVPVMLIVLWLTVSTTASAILSRSDPATAIRFDGGNSRALERAAFLAASETTPAGARHAIGLGARALKASPISSEGAAAIGTGQIILNPQADMAPVFRYSQSLSRRTPLTEIWFIEHSAAQGDIPGALSAYDHLFRVSDAYRAQFLPVLLSATAQPEIARAMVRILARRPAWRDEYFRGLVETFPGPDNFAMLVRVFRFDPADPAGALRLTLAMNRLVQVGRPDLAYGIYRQATGGAGDGLLVRDGDFRRVGPLAPFDWNLTESENLVAEAGTNDAGEPALLLSNRGGRPGVLARQLMVLRPGDYRLTFTVGDVGGESADRPRMQVQCVSGSPVLLSLPFPAAPAGGRVIAGTFAVPARACAAQWLIIQAGNPVDAISTPQWMNRIRIAADTAAGGR